MQPETADRWLDAWVIEATGRGLPKDGPSCQAGWDWITGETMMTFRRAWPVTVDGVEHEVVVEYAALFGWMSIFVDEVRVARAWREWQSVWGGADLSSDLAGHRLFARVTQPYGRQEYSFALSVDGVIQPGSDDLPPPRAVKRSTVIALGVLALVVAAVTLMTQVFR